jgi:hypothetical protein
VRQMAAFALLTLLLCASGAVASNVSSLEVPMAAAGAERALEGSASAARSLLNTQSSWSNDAGCTGGTFAFSSGTGYCRAYSCAPYFGSNRLISTSPCTCMNTNECVRAQGNRHQTLGLPLTLCPLPNPHTLFLPLTQLLLRVALQRRKHCHLAVCVLWGRLADQFLWHVRERPSGARNCLLGRVAGAPHGLRCAVALPQY